MKLSNIIMARSKSRITRQSTGRNCKICGRKFTNSNSDFVDRMLKIHLERNHNLSDEEIERIFNEENDFVANQVRSRRNLGSHSINRNISAHDLVILLN